MTEYGDAPVEVRKLVVVLDICSSTAIFEDLKRIDQLILWRNFIIGLKETLSTEGLRYEMTPYNFIGDGWVLLFPSDIPTDSVCALLQVVSKRFADAFENEISPLLSQTPNPIGLTFGIDEGELIHLVMNEQNEYLGRAINVASRLQSCTKELDGGPSYKALFSKNSFNRHPFPPVATKAYPVVVPLRNMSPPTSECFAVQIIHSPEKNNRKRGGGFNLSRNSRTGI